jgi:hypothetical protein
LNGVLPINRDTAFDIDDDILILPDFISRKVNKALVIPFHKLPLIAEASTKYGELEIDIQ